MRSTPVQDVDNRPIRIESDQTFVELAVGNGHACAIGADALAYCWGDGSAGQVGRPPSGRSW
jgi:alpha-tubulin suppressor-like RCC1 family protein